MNNILKFFLVAVLAAVLQGCAAVGAGIGLAMDAIDNPTDKTVNVVEVGEVKSNRNIDMSAIKTARISSAIFKKDMMTAESSPDQYNSKVNHVFADEAKRFFGINNNSSSSLATLRFKTYFSEINPYGWSGWYYFDVTEKKTLDINNRGQMKGVRKIINAHLLLELNGNTALEVHGLWVGASQIDEIAGARQLAREMAKEVLKKLNASGAERAAAETKKE